MLLAEAVDGEDTVCAHDGAHEGREWRGELNERDQIRIPPKTGLRVHWRHLAVQQVLGELRHAPPALHARAHHGATALSPQVSPDARIETADGAMYTPTTAPSTRPQTRCSRDVSRASLEGVMVFDHPRRCTTTDCL